MRITLVCVGRAANAPEQEICDALLKRGRGAGKSLGFTDIAFLAVDTSRAATLLARKAEEAERLTKHIPPAAHRIALDEKGKAFGSEDFAKRLGTLRDNGVRDLVFLIGGPDGFLPAFRDNTEERLAFGPQTWPHLLVRAMLAEQIFRGIAILAGHPYHRGG
jgi:23S rRNA (pseudouridine1915-N3)-methyltransferase